MNKLINNIKEFVTKDLQWKVLSVILAVFLWFACMNITNPITSAKETVLLEIRGLEELTTDKKMLQNQSALENTSISVEVRGKALEVSNLKGKINAYIDVSVYKALGADRMGDSISTPIYVENAGNYDFEVIGGSLKKIDITIDSVVTVTKSISFTDTGTTVAEGYAYTTPTIEPSTVQITGASTQIKRIKTLSVSVDLTDADETIHRSCPIRAFDEDGKEIFVDMTEKQAMVTIPVSKVGKAAVASPTYTGRPAEGYAVSGIDYNPKELEIMGTKEDVDEFITKKIKLTPIDIEGKSTTQRDKQDLRTKLNDTKLNLVNNTPYECNITIWIEPLVTKTMIIPMEEIDKKGYTLGAQIMSTEIEVEVEGLQRNIDALTKLTASVNLSDLQPGQNAVPVEIEAVTGITIKQQTETVDIVVTELADE